jgi:hypothetical protein
MLKIRLERYKYPQLASSNEALCDPKPITISLDMDNSESDK